MNNAPFGLKFGTCVAKYTYFHNILYKVDNLNSLRIINKKHSRRKDGRLSDFVKFLEGVQIVLALVSFIRKDNTMLFSSHFEISKINLSCQTNLQHLF